MKIKKIVIGLVCFVSFSAGTLTQAMRIKDVCDGLATCMPVENDSTVKLHVDFAYYPSRDLQPGDVRVASNPYVNYAGTDVTVTNMDNNFQIYKGFLKNYTGLACDNTECILITE